jgi:dihydroorotate dehydrogenase
MTTVCNAIEFIMAGVSPVQVGTVSFANSQGPIEVLEGTKDFPKKEKINRPTHIVGVARR